MGCNQTKPKKELVRVVRAPDGSVSIDAKGKVSGRGVYICPDPACLRKAVKAGRLSRNLGVEIPEEIIKLLSESIVGGDGNDP